MKQRRMPSPAFGKCGSCSYQFRPQDLYVQHDSGMLECNGCLLADEPEVIAADDQSISYSDARVLWEAGEFSSWVGKHGFPLIINGVEYTHWEGVEEALSGDTWDA